ncbi:glycosyl hydrolase [Aspergillus desertorum]
MPYTNPILPGSNPDPSIVRVGHDYFLVTSTFEYTPSAPIYHSRDLIQWKLITHAITRPSQLQIQTPEPGGGVWATTIRYHEATGTFYVITASFSRYRPQDDDRVWPRGFYVKTDWKGIWDPTGNSWSESVWLDAVGFDQDLFFDDDGTVYLSSTYRKHQRTLTGGNGKPLKDFAIHISTIDLQTGNVTSAPKLIRSSSSGVSEGSHIFKRGKYYYLFTAEGGTESGHSEWVCRSESSPFGPWVVGPAGEVNPLFGSGVSREDEVQNTGHADFVEDTNGNWWAVFLGVRPVWREAEQRWEESVFGRETFLVPVTWENDWPVVNSKQRITLIVDSPHLYHYTPSVNWRDDFASETLQLGWYRKNTPLKKDYTLLVSSPHADQVTSVNRGLRLFGAPYTLSTPSCPTLFLRKQTARYYTWETKLRFFPDSLNVEAGTVVYLNYLTFASVGIRLAASQTETEDPSRSNPEDDGKKRKRIIRFTPSNTHNTPGFSSEAVDIPLVSSSSAVILRIECGDSYRFGFREVLADQNADAGSGLGAEESETISGETQWVGEVSNRALMEAPLPIGAPFTGAMLGLYSVGDREAVRAPADFEYAQIIG